METNNKIHILSDFLANQIAAGEVVQRPESVVKELIENSLDANASRIAVFIKDAGKSLIQVIDNGYGMSNSDLLLAPIRHATSKIYSQDDLNAIRTFGFRGEALPSISSVSLLEIKSKQKDTATGWKLIAEPMKKDFQLEEVIMENGTQISVRNLFYNVPARRKFLKSNVTELKHINETILKFALAHPNVHFIYYNNDLLVFDAYVQPLEERINTLLGMNNMEVDEPLLPVNLTMNDITINGYIGHPQLAKKTNTTQYFFLNGRSINSKMLSFAVFSGMEHLLEKGLKPFFILNIILDYRAVDVNVHPQKSEVKFEDEHLIYSIIKKAVQNALQININKSNENNFDAISITNEKGISENVIVNKNTGEIHSPNNLRYEKLVSKLGHISNTNYKYKNANYTPKDINYNQYNSKNINQSVELLYSNKSINKDISLPQNSTTDASNNIELQHDALLNAEVINQENLWQYHNKYILLQTETGLLAIDQHNAHERIIYEKLIENIHNNTPTKQGLLFDVSIPLNSLQMLTIKEIENELKNIGFEFTINSNDIVISAIPHHLEVGLVDDFTDIINDYNDNEDLKHTPKQERITTTISCKSAIKAGNKLSYEEMQSIVTNLLQCKMQYVCPHGRPIIVSFPISEWDKKFGRA